MTTWNPWHGCSKISEGCRNCYVYRIDGRHGKDSRVVSRTQNFNLPLKRNRAGVYKVPAGEEIYTCFSSDFFLDQADPWRAEVWAMIRERKDCSFIIITKRIQRFYTELPEDWGTGYENVCIGTTVENQAMAEQRLPFFLELPIRHKMIICEPLLSAVDLSPYLHPSIELVVAGGESGTEARVCKHEWVLQLHRQCVQHTVPFRFKQTGFRYEKDARLFLIPRHLQHSQARKAGLDFS